MMSENSYCIIVFTSASGYVGDVCVCVIGLYP